MTKQDTTSTADEIYGVLRREGRATPSLIEDRISQDITRQRINTVLNRLQAQGRIRRVHRGLYEAVPDASCARAVQITLNDLYRVEGGQDVETTDSYGDPVLVSLEPVDDGFAPGERVSGLHNSADNAGDGE